jgi:hypothetical protein
MHPPSHLPAPLRRCRPALLRSRGAGNMGEGERHAHAPAKRMLGVYQADCGGGRTIPYRVPAGYRDSRAACERAGMRLGGR